MGQLGPSQALRRIRTHQLDPPLNFPQGQVVMMTFYVQSEHDILVNYRIAEY